MRAMGLDEPESLDELLTVSAVALSRTSGVLTTVGTRTSVTTLAAAGGWVKTETGEEVYQAGFRFAHEAIYRFTQAELAQAGGEAGVATLLAEDLMKTLRESAESGGAFRKVLMTALEGDGRGKSDQPFGEGPSPATRRRRYQ